MASKVLIVDDDPVQRVNQRNHFNKNLGLIGGLIIIVISGGRRGRA